MLSKDKSKTLIFNFTNNFQFATQASMENFITEVIRETKLLRVVINNHLNWDSNTEFLMKKAKTCMGLLHKLVDFIVPTDDLKKYTSFTSGPISNNLVKSVTTL